MENLFRIFNSEQIIFLVQAIMLERKIILIRLIFYHSKHKSLLTQVVLALTTLIYPFTY